MDDDELTIEALDAAREQMLLTPTSIDVVRVTTIEDALAYALTGTPVLCDPLVGAYAKLALLDRHEPPS